MVNRRCAGVTYPTARSDVDSLVKLSVLEKLDLPKRPAVYYAPEIFRIAYGEIRTPDEGIDSV